MEISDQSTNQKQWHGLIEGNYFVVPLKSLIMQLMCSDLGNLLTLWNYDVPYTQLWNLQAFLKCNMFFIVSFSTRSNIDSSIKTVAQEHHKHFELVSDYKLNWLGLYLFHCGTHSYPIAWSKHFFKLDTKKFIQKSFQGAFTQAKWHS